MYGFLNFIVVLVTVCYGSYIVLLSYFSEFWVLLCNVFAFIVFTDEYSID